LLEETRTCIKPATTCEDNADAMFLVKNQQVGQQTEHVAIGARFIRDFWSQGHSDAQFARSEDCESDMHAKNVTEKILTTFSPRTRARTLRCWRNWNKLNEKTVGHGERTCDRRSRQTNA
jgi:hypothetical protein